MFTKVASPNPQLLPPQPPPRLPEGTTRAISRMNFGANPAEEEVLAVAKRERSKSPREAIKPRHRTPSFLHNTEDDLGVGQDEMLPP